VTNFTECTTVIIKQVDRNNAVIAVTI